MQYPLTEAVSELLETPVRENSVNAMVHCPFHQDRRASLSIHLIDGVWHCFSCGDSGTLNQLYYRVGKEVDYGVRLHMAKQRADDPIISTHNLAAVANKHIADARRVGFPRLLRTYLRGRPIRPEALEAYGVGLDAERKALSFPYEDTDSRVMGIKYRTRDGFKFSAPGSTYGIFGLTHVLGKEKVIICEGETDTLAVASRYGQSYGVGGTSGASVSDTQWSRLGLHLLFARRIYLLYDADAPGDECAATAMSVLGTDKCVRLRPADGANDACEFLANGGSLEALGLEA